MALKLITAPTDEPVSLAEAKSHIQLHSSVTNQDSRIEGWIASARKVAEHETGRALMPQTWELALDEFEDEIILSKPPLVSITSFTYVDEDGATQTLTTDDYQLDSHSEPARIVPAYGTCWPATRRQPNAVLVRFQCGYADAESVPAEIRDWILLRVETSYRNRGATTEYQANVLKHVDRLLDGAKVYG